MDIRPSVLDLGLIPALRWLVNDKNTGQNISVIFHVFGTEHKLSALIEISIFRVLQEALNNIKRHAYATLVAVEIYFNEQSLNIKVKDNGKGFDVPSTFGYYATNGKLGLIGMKQRIDQINGNLQIFSKPGEGTELIIEVKYHPDNNV
jgi:two-component system sensor histidine kinase DegS